MKTKKQIEYFLSRRKYKSEMDYEGISLYCKEKFGIKLHHPSSYPQEESSLTYAQFAEWLEHGYGAGDAVMYGETLCLVQSSDPTQVKICLRIDRNTPNFNLITLPVQVITPAEKSSLERISRVLLENGLEFGNPFNVITPKYIPKSGVLVVFRNLSTDEEGYGCVRTVTDQGEVYMFCYVLKTNAGKIVKYDMHEYLGLAKDFAFRDFKPTDYERKALETELEKHGKTWNHFMKRIEPVDMKVGLGETYWYISDKLTVASATEKGAVTSHKRYLASNYFKNPEDASLIEAQLHEMIRDFLALPKHDAK